MVAKPIALKARLVFPVASPPLDGGVVTLLGDRIVAVGRNETTVPARDLGDVALLPGLINAHTHLEFSNLTHPLGYRGIRLPDWIAEVVSRRRLESDQDGAPLSVGRRLAAMERGVSESQGGGVTTLGNIVTWDDTDLVPSDGGVRWHEFRELMGLSGQRVAEQVLFAHEYLRTASSVKWRFAPGFSPHAPYTTALQLVDEIVEMSARHRLNVAMHLAESREELQLLETGGGPFRELLEKFGVWDNRAFAERAPASRLFAAA